MVALFITHAKSNLFLYELNHASFFWLTVTYHATPDITGI